MSSSLLRIARLLAPLAATVAAAQPPFSFGVDPTLILRQPVSDSLGAGEVRRYQVRLAAKQFVAGEVDQRTVDAMMTILAPDGRTIGTFDYSGRGGDAFHFSTDVAGIYRVEVRGFQDDQGSYAIELRHIERVATAAAQRARQLLLAYDRTDAPGAAVIVVHNGRTLFSGGFGTANLEHDVPITPTTVFDAASLAKQFTGFAIAMLHERGALSLDDPIGKHLPDMPPVVAAITVRQLVHHTSGLRDWAEATTLAGLRDEDVITFRDVMDFARRHRELSFKPGSAMLYSNTGYVALARIVELVTGKPFAVWMGDNVFAPLGMAESRFAGEHGTLVAKRADSYTLAAGGGWRNVANNLSSPGSSSLFTTTEDLARWMTNFARRKVGSAATHELMRTRGVLNNGDTTAYAFGLEVNWYRGFQRLGHSGSWGGYTSRLHYYPSLDAGVVVLANGPLVDVDRLAAELAELFFDGLKKSGSPGGNAAAPTGSGPGPTAKAYAWSPGTEELQAFVGRYYGPELQTMYTVALREGGLVMVIPRQAPIVLRPLQKDVFAGNKASFAEVRFERNATGAISALRVSNGRIRNLLFERH